MALSLRLTGDTGGVVVHHALFPPLGSHVIAEREQQVLLDEALVLVLPSCAKTGKTQSHVKIPASFHLLISVHIIYVESQYNL